MRGVLALGPKGVLVTYSLSRLALLSQIRESEAYETA
jgi:hypothetical protein